MRTFDEFVAAARAAYPGLEVPIDELLAAAKPPYEDLIAGDVLLACAAHRGDPRALAEVERYFVRLGPALRGTGLSSDEVDEVTQQLRTRLFVDGKLATYAGRGPLEHWLRIVGLRHAREWRASRQRRARLVETFTSAVATAANDDPELVHVRDRYGALFREALAAAVAALDTNDRELVRRVVEGATPADIGELLGVHRTTAMRRIDRACDALRDGVKREFVQRLGIDRNAANRLMTLYDTGFQLGLRAMLENR